MRLVEHCTPSRSNCREVAAGRVGDQGTKCGTRQEVASGLQECGMTPGEVVNKAGMDMSHRVRRRRRSR